MLASRRSHDATGRVTQDQREEDLTLPHRPWRILWVDDDPDFLHLARRILHRSRRLRAEVETASGSHEALRILNERAVDVLVTDFRTAPDDAAEMLRDASAVRPGLKRVMVTGYDNSFLKQSMDTHDVDLILPKDDLLTELDRKLTEFLEKQPGRRDERP